MSVPLEWRRGVFHNPRSAFANNAFLGDILSLSKLASIRFQFIFYPLCEYRNIIFSRQIAKFAFFLIHVPFYCMSLWGLGQFMVLPNFLYFDALSNFSFLPPFVYVLLSFPKIRLKRLLPVSLPPYTLASMLLVKHWHLHQEVQLSVVQ